MKSWDDFFMTKDLNDIRLMVEAELENMTFEDKQELQRVIERMEEDMARQRKINDITPAEWDAMAERGKETQAQYDALNKQVGGQHYASMKIQPVEFITANELGFLEGNVVKYICRHHAKNGAEDIKKAIHYCELLLQTKYGD